MKSLAVFCCQTCTVCLGVNTYSVLDTQLLISQLFSLWKIAASFCLCWNESGVTPSRAAVMCGQGKELALQKGTAVGCLSVLFLWPPCRSSLANEEQNPTWLKRLEVSEGKQTKSSVWSESEILWISLHLLVLIICMCDCSMDYCLVTPVSKYCWH